MSIAPTISFKPQHFRQVQTGELSGKWAPVIPAFKDSELTTAAFAKEAAQLHAEGGVVSFGDALVSIPELLETIKRVLADLPAQH